LFSIAECVALRAPVVDEHEWLFAVSGNRRPDNYIDEDGTLKGFVLDLTYAVCELADKSCDFVTVPIDACVTNVGDDWRPGEALVRGDFDACPSRGITDERKQFAEFTLPYTENRSNFFVAPGNPRNFSDTSLDGKTVAYLLGSYPNRACIEKINRGNPTMVTCPGVNECRNVVINQEVDALFSFRTRLSGLQRIGQTYYECSDGSAVMAMKDRGLVSWWNPAFSELKASGRFREICDDIVLKHGGRNSTRCILP